MPYIGRAATNTGNVRYLDNIASGFDGSDTTFTAQVGGVSITPDQESVKIFLDGVFQHPGSGNAYTISGSTITFTAAPVANTVFSAYVVGAGAYLDDNAVSSAKLDDDAVTAAKLDDDGTGFQVGDLGVGGSLTSGDKLTVTGRLRASGGIIGDLTGNVTGNASGTALTVTQAAQTAITSVGTLTSFRSTGIDDNADATAITIDSSERVGIGISSSITDPLHVKTTAVETRISLESSTGKWAIGAEDGDKFGILNYGTSTPFLIDSAGTIFQGTTSPTLHSSVRGIIFENGALINDITRGAGKSITLAQNVVIDSGNTWAYLATDEASYYQQFGGNHYFATCASGTAGADATLTSKLTIANDGTSTFAGQILGSASGVAYSFTGDPDTGVQSGGTNTLQITTAGAKAVDFDANQLATFTGDITMSQAGQTILHLNSSGDASEVKLTSNQGTWSIFSDNAADAFLINDGTTRFTLTSALATFTTDLKISDDLYFNGSDANAWIIGKTNGSGTLRIQNFADIRIDGSEVAIKPPSSASANFYLQANGSNDARINFATQQSGTFWSLMMDHSDSQKIFFVDENGNDGVYMDTNNTSWQSNSDERMKENLVDLNGALANLNTLRCVNFNMKHDKDNKRIGLIAQDVYKVYPEATSGSPDSEYSFDESRDGNSHKGAMGLRYTEMIAPMIKAIQELSAKVEALENA